MREDLARAGGRGRVPVAALFEAFQVRRPTERARTNVAELLEASGVGSEPPLEAAAPDGEVTLYLRDGWHDGAQEPPGAYDAAVLAYCSRVCIPERVADATAAAFVRVAALPPGAGTREVLRVARGAAAEYAPSPPESRQAGVEDRLRRFVSSDRDRRQTCRLVPTLLAARASGELGAADVERLERHLARCPDCPTLARTMDDAERAFHAMLGAAPALRVSRPEPAEPEAEVELVPPPPPPMAEPEPEVVEPVPELVEPEAVEPEPAEAELVPPPPPPPPPPPAPFAEPVPVAEPEAVAEPEPVEDAELEPVAAAVADDPDAPKARPKRPPLSRARKFVATVCAVAGVLIFTEGLVTILWKEPFSSFLAAQAQGQLSDDLDALDKSPIALRQNERAALRHIRNTRKRQKRRLALLARSLNVDVGAGEALARLNIDKIKLHTVVVQTTDAASLRKGPSHYGDTILPGQKGTVGIAGHRTTYGAPFRHIDDLEKGDAITVEMPYGRFTYVVEGHKIVPAGESDAFKHERGRPRLVLSACHPLYSASQRILVYAKLVKVEPTGPGLIDEGSDQQTTREEAQALYRSHLRSFGKKELFFGVTSDAVKAVQRLLGLPETGYFGNETTAAVMQFQRQHGLTPDGSVGSQTKKALARRKHPPARPPTPPPVAPVPPPSSTTPTTPTTPGVPPPVPQPQP